MPTILSVAGIDPPKEHSLDGIDLSPVLFEQKALPARPLFWADLSNNGSRSEALRDGSWKLVVQHPKAKPGTFENDAIELFNLTNDEGEKTNLAAKQAERAAAMLKQLKAWYADTQETASPQPGGWIRKPHGELPELLAASIYGSPNVDIAVPNGPYTLQLLLYEGWRSRSADIVIEGKTVRAAYDMFKEQGGNFDHGSVLRHTFTLTDGNIDIEIKGPLHLGGLILSKGKADSEDRVAIVKSQADLDLKDVIKAINFGETRNLSIGNVKFTAAAVNTTVDGVTNKAAGDVHTGQFAQKLPTILKDKSHVRLGDDLMKVQLSANSSRGGLLGMGSILTVTSHPTRTSAVDRGLWVYEKLFGKRLPDPPVVPALEEGTGEAGATRTFREVLEKHRENKQCASCHNKIDPIGFGLENFDAVGRWRKVDGGKPIDATGVLPSGRTFEGPSELKRQLVTNKADFYRNMAQTVLTYALGRKLEFYDRPEVDKIVQQLMATDGQSHELFKMVAKSYPFTHAGGSKTSKESQ